MSKAILLWYGDRAMGECASEAEARAAIPEMVKELLDSGIDTVDYSLFFAIKRPARPVGRPPSSPDDRAPPRSVRLNAGRWAKLRRLGRAWLERAIDAA